MYPICWLPRTTAIAGLLVFLALPIEVAVSAEPSARTLPTEEVQFGEGELVTLHGRPRDTTPWMLPRDFASQFEALAVRARAGDAIIAENLFVAVSRCEGAPRSREELDHAVQILREEHKLVQPDGVLADVRSGAPIEDLVASLLIEPFEDCRELTNDQRNTAREWLTLAVDLGNADAAIRAVEFVSDSDEKQRLYDIIWSAGDSSVLGAQARIFEERSRSGSPKRDDLIQAYAYQYALNKIAEFFARHYPPLPIRGRVHKDISDTLERLGQDLTADEKSAAVRMAADLVRSNPNCCDIL